MYRKLFNRETILWEIFIYSGNMKNSYFVADFWSMHALIKLVYGMFFFLFFFWREIQFIRYVMHGVEQRCKCTIY